MKRKVKKFGRGGDIVTGIGAALLGKALYDKYSSKDDTQKNLDTIEAAPKDRGRKGEDLIRDAINPKREKYVAADEEENAAKKEALSRGMQYKKPEAAPTASNAAGNKNRNASNAAGNNASNAAGDKNRATDKVGAGYEDVTRRLRAFTPPSAPNLKPGESKSVGGGGFKPYPSSNITEAKKKEVRDRENEAIDKDKNYAPTGKEFRRAVRETFPYTSDLGDPRGTAEMRARNADPSRAYLHKMAEEGKEKERQRQAEQARNAAETAKKRKSISEVRYDEMGNPYKRGGAVKKYASGGSVSSASKRADGIAQRGKTRGKVY